MIEQSLLKALADPAFYPHGPESVEIRQTHISVLALAGELVYKVKKPVDFGFCDFTTLDKRRHFCHEEVRLNRRLAPDVYRRVAPIVRRPDGGFELDGEGEPVEYAVEMRRLPADLMLPALLASGRLSPDDVASLARVVHEFHRRAARSEAVDAYGRAEVIEEEVRQNFEQLEPYAGRTIEPGAFEWLRRRSERFLEVHRRTFSQRIAEGRIVEGHGDLHADHICLEPRGISIYDCIEFNEAFRCLDVASEVAFLAMDLDFLGHPEISSAFLHHYRALSEDAGLPALLPFYQSYRAVVRGKVESFRLRDEDIPEDARAEAEEAARKYLELACRYARSFDLPALVVCCGIIGTGKSTLALALATSLEGVVLRSDSIRKELAGVPAEARHVEPFGSGLYEREMTERTYQALLERARPLLADGRTVILDASFARRVERNRARLLAAETEAEAWCLWLECSEEEIRRRLKDRAAEGAGPSDAREELFEPFARAFQPPNEWPAENLIRVDAERPPADCAARVLDRLRPSPSPAEPVRADKG